MGDIIAQFIIITCPIVAVAYGAFVIADDDFASDYSDTFLGKD